MKAATVWAVTVEVVCPACFGRIALWDVRTYQTRADSGEPVQCDRCGERVRLPIQRTALMEAAP